MHKGRAKTKKRRKTVLFNSTKECFCGIDENPISPILPWFFVFKSTDNREICKNSYNSRL